MISWSTEVVPLLKRRILVIDDDGGVRYVMRRILERAGYDVALAGDGFEGIEQYRTDQADLVITDVFMPEKEGLETIRDLRREFPQAKVVAISAKEKGGSLMVLPAAQELGAVRTLSKPFGEAELLEVVEAALEA